MRVVIAEDLALLRDGLTRLLRDNGIEVVAAVPDGDSLVREVVAQKPDLAVVDIRLPPGYRDEGLRAALEARRRVPGPRCWWSRSTSSRPTPRSCSPTAAAASATCSRTASCTWPTSWRRSAGSPTAAPRSTPRWSPQLFSRRRSDGPLERLTPREREVLAMMAEGRSNAGIAEALVLTVGAVEKHVQSILSKLDLPQSATDHRRVLAVLAYLQGQE